VNIRLLWPGKTKNAALGAAEEFYLKRIRQLIPCDVLVTPGARGLDDRHLNDVRDVEARGLEKHFKDDYIVCLFDEGLEMNSQEFARFFERRAAESVRTVTFVVGGCAGLARRVLDRAKTRLSLSRLTFSHELCRVVLMEQIYRSISIMKGRPYAK
jgi:23S rRNA (pseudouridine1915-N3)-methyltransferase